MLNIVQPFLYHLCRYGEASDEERADTGDDVDATEVANSVPPAAVGGNNSNSDAAKPDPMRR